MIRKQIQRLTSPMIIYAMRRYTYRHAKIMGNTNCKMASVSVKWTFQAFFCLLKPLTVKEDQIKVSIKVGKR